MNSEPTKCALLLRAALALLVCPLAARADFHYVVLANPGHEKNLSAELDVGTDLAPQIVYQVYPTTQPAPAPVPFDPDNQFAATVDLFSLVQSTPALVFAATADGQTPPQFVVAPSQAVLRLGKGGMLVVPPVQNIVGTQFAVPIGSLDRGAVLYIANPGTNASDCDAIVNPTPLTPGVTYHVPLNGVVEVPITIGNTRLFVFSPNGVPLLVQLAIIEKSGVQMTLVPRLVP